MNDGKMQPECEENVSETSQKMYVYNLQGPIWQYFLCCLHFFAPAAYVLPACVMWASPGYCGFLLKAKDVQLG